MEENKPAYIVFGASGDLAQRYLLPALKKIGVNAVPISREDYPDLKSIIPEAGEKIFHLAIPARGIQDAAKIIHQNFGKDNIKILMEKPFGENLESSRELIVKLDDLFPESQIYRVDHYLAKKSAQKILNLPGEKENIEHMEIIASEALGIEGRVHFYEETGALKDMVQSHLLSLAALALGEENTPESRLEVLKNLAVVCDITKSECVKRGQYEGYKEEVGNLGSRVETFVSINMVWNDPAWRGMRLTLATGKALREKRTEVRIKYKNGTMAVWEIEPEPDAYEKVLQAAISGDRNIFLGNGEILERWRILEDIQNTWQNSAEDLVIYPKGTDIEEII